MSRNPEFLELLEKMKITHEKKSNDYSDDSNVFSNFEYAAQLASVFTDEVDRVFATLVGVKLARICELRKGKVPNNESIEDSFLDLSNYCAIWGSRVMKLSRGNNRQIPCRLCGKLIFSSFKEDTCATVDPITRVCKA